LSPPCLQPSLIDQINIDLTPIIYSVFYELKISISLLLYVFFWVSIYPNLFFELAHAFHQSTHQDKLGPASFFGFAQGHRTFAICHRPFAMGYRPFVHVVCVRRGSCQHVTTYGTCQHG
jgi:hypothetical protein